MSSHFTGLFTEGYNITIQTAVGTVNGKKVADLVPHPQSIFTLHAVEVYRSLSVAGGF